MAIGLVVSQKIWGWREKRKKIDKFEGWYICWAACKKVGNEFEKERQERKEEKRRRKKSELYIISQKKAIPKLHAPRRRYTRKYCRHHQSISPPYPYHLAVS